MTTSHIFYHADRAASLKEGQIISLDENDLSYFGKAYWPTINTKSVEEMDPMQLREYYLEMIKREPIYFQYASRMQSIFAANTITEAIAFANSIVPKPSYPIPIIEIFADRFWSLDSNWLDYETRSVQQQIENYRNYWDGKISNHHPEEGKRKPPMLEVMIALPAITGKIVHISE